MRGRFLGVLTESVRCFEHFGIHSCGSIAAESGDTIEHDPNPAGDDPIAKSRALNGAHAAHPYFNIIQPRDTNTFAVVGVTDVQNGRDSYSYPGLRAHVELLPGSRGQ